MLFHIHHDSLLDSSGSLPDRKTRSKLRGGTLLPPKPGCHSYAGAAMHIYFLSVNASIFVLDSTGIISSAIILWFRIAQDESSLFWQSKDQSQEKGAQ